tara:strand:- start:59 stop:397 length:339 start_codon:yes stop_codon:yes gene_type:complete
MKKLLILLLLLPLAVSARMFPTEFPIKAVCWDNVEEALEYHQEILGEYPIGKGWITSTDDPSFAAIMYNPIKPSWTFLSFHKNKDAIIVCAITGGSMWEIINLGDEVGKLQL